MTNDEHHDTTTDEARPQPFATPPAPAEDEELVRRRQHARAMVMAWLLGAFVILLFAITLVKIKINGNL